MGYGFEADMERLTKALSKNVDGSTINLGLYSDPAQKMCMPAPQVGRRSKETICFRSCPKLIRANSGALIL
jgi:hypothetical protein